MKKKAEDMETKEHSNVEEVRGVIIDARLSDEDERELAMVGKKSVLRVRIGEKLTGPL